MWVQCTVHLYHFTRYLLVLFFCWGPSGDQGPRFTEPTCLFREVWSYTLKRWGETYPRVWNRRVKKQTLQIRCDNVTLWVGQDVWYTPKSRGVLVVGRMQESVGRSTSRPLLPEDRGGDGRNVRDWLQVHGLLLLVAVATFLIGIAVGMFAF